MKRFHVCLDCDSVLYVETPDENVAKVCRQETHKLQFTRENGKKVEHDYGIDEEDFIFSHRSALLPAYH